MTIVNDDSRVIHKLGASFTDDARVIIYDRHMFIVQATGLTNNYLIMLKRLPTDKRSSLFVRKFGEREKKSFIQFSPRVAQRPGPVFIVD